MRILIAALALCLAACGPVVVSDGPVSGGSEGEVAAAAGPGYTLEVRALAGEQTYLVTAPDGLQVAARAAGGASALLDAGAMRALAATPPPQSAAPEVMALRMPGFEMSIGAESKSAGGDNGNVSISIGGGDGERIQINAHDGGDGDNVDSAHVLITGADAQSVREFIAEADELSPSVQGQMLAALGLEAAQEAKP